MDRAGFGQWGANLNADDFAKALAAAGVLAAMDDGGRADDPAEIVFKRLISAIERVPPGEALVWRPPLEAVPDAGLLAALWGDVIGIANRPLRLAVGELDARESPMWLVETLAREAVGLASVVVQPWTAPIPIARVAWQWPVDIGLLPDTRSTTLRDSISTELSIEEIADLYEIGTDQETCDLLLLPYDLRDALVHALATPVRASCVVVLGAAKEPWERMRPMLETLVAHARASAIAVAGVPEDQRTEWLGALMQELAQDAGLDVALHRATPGTPPFFVAPERMLRRTRMGPIIRELEEMATAAPPEVGAEIEEALGDAIESVDIPEPLFRGLVPANGGPRAFERPPEPASRVANATRVAREVKPAPEPRFVHADVTTHDTGARVTTLDAWTPYNLNVDIGPADPDRAHAPIPVAMDTLFQHGEETHRLRVFVTDLRGEQEPAWRDIVLPRIGRSTQATFPLVTQSATTPIEMRVIVMHRNRVLQTLKLRATVGEPDSLALAEEIVARTQLDDLDGRSRFDLALIVNHTDAGDHGLTAIAGERAVVMWEESFDTHITRLRDRLDWVTTRVSMDTGLGSEVMREFLVSLARNGGPIGDALRDVMGDAWSGFASMERIQVVSASIEAYLPLELVYELPVPRQDAVVCPNAAIALATGECTECRTRPRADQQGFVCPLGFWALSKVIERQAFDPAEGRAIHAAGANFALLAEPRSGRKAIGSLNRIVYAASSRANDVVDGTIEATATALQRWSADTFRQATDWATWTAAIEDIRPDLLVMLPHTAVDDVGEPVLEVGKEQILHVVEIDAHHVAVDETLKPMVLLLGCATGSPDYPLLKLPTSFRRRGASIVLTTLTTVLGRHAGPVASMLVDAMHDLPAGDTRTFGEISRDVRRKALAEGNLMALVLAAYGDADWHLGA